MGLFIAIALGVHRGISGAHFFRDILHFIYLDKCPFVHSRAAKCGFFPACGTLHDFGPERKHAALYWFHRMNRALAIPVKQALPVRGFTQPEGAGGTMDILRLKLTRIRGNVIGDTNKIILSEVDFSLHLAAGGTAGLALETEPGYFENNRFTPVVMIRSFLWKPGSGLLT
jgi:hypothetical protein